MSAMIKTRDIAYITLAFMIAATGLLVFADSEPLQHLYSGSVAELVALRDLVFTWVNS